MELKNFLTSGDYCYPLPLGLDMQVRYNVNGKVESLSVLNTKTGELTPMDNDMLNTFVTKHIIPIAINIKQGTTLVSGVLAVQGQHAYMFSGSVDDIKDVILADMKEHLDTYKFYAYHVWSGAANFKGSQATKNWLGINKFDELNGFLCPAIINEESISNLVSYYSKNFPIITKYFYYHNEQTSYIHRNIVQKITKNITTDYDINGFLHTYITYTDKTEGTFNFTDKLKFGLMQNDNILLIEDGRIIYNFNYTQPDNSAYSFTCNRCGRIHRITDLVGYVSCENEVCPSKQYVRINRMLSGLNLPMIDEKKYKEVFGSKVVICLADALEWLEYEDDSIHTTLADAIYSVIPVQNVRSKDVIQHLCKNCNYSLQSLDYYLTNPNRITADLPMQDTKNLRDFIDWISVSDNYSEVCAIIGSDKLHISNIDDEKKFEGSPIFRGKKIAITGDFIHGSKDEIIRILKSYSAEIVSSAKEADCVLTGSTLSNIDGNMIREARMNKVYIYDETDFFTAYEIDKDLEENLL